MDGNGRWAKSKGLPRLMGHKKGVESVKEITQECSKLSINYLTLYTFSEQNWNRPIDEVSGLMKLFLKSLKSELNSLNDNNIRFSIIGDIEQLDKKIKNEILYSIDKTKNNTGLNLNLAFNYSGRKEIANMVKNIVDSNCSVDLVNDEMIREYLYTSEIPDPDLLIRTGGEFRISNFLLWQIAYSEIYFTNTYWPAFRGPELFEAIAEYQSRERRFGKVSEQLS
tara:strand:- start:549 stop:1220 length:672 start_codon:yes stop_codon:yes gene_type:complete